MKTLRRIILIILFIAAGCSIKAPCPPEDAFYVITFPNGRQAMVHTEEGWFDNKQDEWATKEEFQGYLEEAMKDIQEEKRKEKGF